MLFIGVWRLIAVVQLLSFVVHGDKTLVKPAEQNLVVLAQGRSGSSFLSSWFNAHPNVTYFLEPCSLVYMREVTRDKTGESCNKVIRQLFQCDFSSVDLERDQRMYIPDTAKGFKGWGHQKGGDDVKSCRERSLRVFKELRIGVAWAEKKFNFDKLIVLLRDPRAIINSRLTGWPKRGILNDWTPNPIGWDGQRGFPYDQSLRSLCLEHLKLRERVEAEADSNRVMLVEYEEVLRDPQALLKRVMDFAGLPLAAEVLEFLEKNTKGECEHKNEPFSVCRSGLAGKKDSKWRKSLPESELKLIEAQPECAKVIEEYYSFDDKAEL